MITRIKNAFFQKESGEDFHLGATITMILLILTFISTSFYIAVSSLA